MLMCNILQLNLATAWEVDFSRRLEFSKVEDQNKLINKETGPTRMERRPAAVVELSAGEAPRGVAATAGIMEQILEGVGPVQDIVILNTEQGFVPAMVQVRQNKSYRVWVVNVNSKDKNNSFIMDAYSQHHNTVFGEPKSFMVTPKVNGVFSFQCPESATQGRWVVLPETKNQKLAVDSGHNKKD